MFLDFSTADDLVLLCGNYHSLLARLDSCLVCIAAIDSFPKVHRSFLRNITFNLRSLLSFATVNTVLACYCDRIASATTIVTFIFDASTFKVTSLVIGGKASTAFNNGQISHFAGKQYIYNVKSVKFNISPKEAVLPSSIDLSKCSPELSKLGAVNSNHRRRQLLPLDTAAASSSSANWTQADEIFASIATGAANFSFLTPEAKKVCWAYHGSLWQLIATNATTYRSCRVSQNCQSIMPESIHCLEKCKMAACAIICVGVQSKHEELLIWSQKLHGQRVLLVGG